MGQVNMRRGVEIVGGDGIQGPSGHHVFSQHLLDLLGKGLLVAGLTAEDIIQDLTGGFILILVADDLIPALTKVVGGGAGGGLEGGNRLGLLLAPFGAGQQLMFKYQEKPPGDGLTGPQLLNQPQIVLLQLAAAFIRLLDQLPAHCVHVPVDVRPLGQHLELYLHRRNFQIADKGIDDTALFPGAAEQKVDRDHLDQLDIAVISGVDDAVGDLLNGNVVSQWIALSEIWPWSA